jgi:tail protein
MDSILFDSVQLISSTYNVSRILDNTTPIRSINLIETEGVDGAVIVNDRFGTKIIKIKGILIGSSASDLQDKIDTANELFSRKDVNLDVTPDGGSARRYVVRLIGPVEYERDFYNIDYVPFIVSFLVAEGVGKATTPTEALSHLNTALERDPTVSGSNTVNLLGSATPKPEIKFTLDTIGKLDLITIIDDDSGEEMSIEIDDTYSASDEIVVSIEEQTVKKNGTSVAFLGKIPSLIKGDNDIHIEYQGATYVIDQQQSTSHAYRVFIGKNVTSQTIAQSFIPGQSGYLSRIKLWVQKISTPDVMQVRVYTDNGDLPYEPLTSGVGFLVPATAFSTDAVGTEATLDDSTPEYYLRKGVKYWLTITTPEIASSYYWIHGSDEVDNEDYYTDGKLLKYDGLAPPTDPADWEDYTGTIADLYFKTYQGQGTPVDWVVDFIISYVKRYL